MKTFKKGDLVYAWDYTGTVYEVIDPNPYFNDFYGSGRDVQVILIRPLAGFNAGATFPLNILTKITTTEQLQLF